jgi:hypothetical protein
MSMRKFSVTVLKMGLLFSICLFLLKPAMAVSMVPIYRPVDGSTVREVVKILVPASSVPANGYVIYNIDGHFKAAQAQATENQEYYVYEWDTKALDPDTSLPMNRRECRDGEHSVSVVVCDSHGRSAGESKPVTVFVKNQLSASDLPGQGIRLRYHHKVGSATKYRFKWKIDLDNVSGNTDLGLLVGNGLEGSEGVIERSTEAVESDGQALVRDQLADSIMTYQNGILVPSAAETTKSSYTREDSLGRATEVKTFEPGDPVGVVLPTLPWQRVKIGDEWTSGQEVLWDALTRQSVKMKTDCTFEGIEWQNGYRCAKLVSRFSETVKLPFSKIIDQPIRIDGETVTYFSYSIGKVVSSITTASAKCMMEQKAVDALLASRMPKNVASNGQPQAGAAANPGESAGVSGGGRGEGGGGRGGMARAMMMGRGMPGGAPGIGGPAGMGEGGSSGAPGNVSRPGETPGGKMSEVVFRITESVEATR